MTATKAKRIKSVTRARSACHHWLLHTEETVRCSLSGCAQTLSLISSALGLFTRKTVRCWLEYDTKILLLGRFSTRFFCSVCQNAWTNLTTMASLRMVAKLRAGVVGCTEPFRYALKTTRSPVKLLHTVNWNYCVGVVKGERYVVARVYRWDRRYCFVSSQVLHSSLLLSACTVHALLVWETDYRVPLNCQIVRLLSEGVMHVVVSILNCTTLKYTRL